MTYSINGTIIIQANGTINWAQIGDGRPVIYHGTQTTRQVSNATSHAANTYGYSIEAANSTSLRLVCTNFNCVCVCECVGGTCFPANSLVMMADGSQKRIDRVQPGDRVYGAFGEINEVLALDRTKLGSRYLARINGNHVTSSEHPHVGPDRKFYSLDVDQIWAEWSQDYPVIVADGNTQMWRNIGLFDRDLIKPLVLGTMLQHFNGPRQVHMLEKVERSPDFPLYNLVVGGSHTYIVDGYAVTGWPRQDDFDYYSWQPIDKHQ